MDAMDDLILPKVQPDYIIFYHLDVAFLRKVEAFQVSRPPSDSMTHLDVM